jgi:RNA polymerase sigma factor (sigma-70 family)
MELPYKEDSETWQLFKDGDKQAFAFIYNKYSPTLYEYGMRMLQHEDSVKDAIHDLFVKLWQNRRSFSVTNNIKYYLIAAFRNTIFTLKGLEDRLPQVELSETDGFDLEFSLEAEYIRNEELANQSAQLLEAMNKLSARQKEIIYLRFFEEMDYNQIAEAMNISVKATYKLSARALDALREIMNLPASTIFFLLLLYRAR